MSSKKPFEPFRWISQDKANVRSYLLEHSHDAFFGIELLSDLILHSNLARECGNEAILSAKDTATALMTIKTLATLMRDNYEKTFIDIK